jgi:hypothetical protein
MKNMKLAKKILGYFLLSIPFICIFGILLSVLRLPIEILLAMIFVPIIVASCIHVGLEFLK